MGYKALKEATSPPNTVGNSFDGSPTRQRPTKRGLFLPSNGLEGDVFKAIPFGDDSLKPLNLAHPDKRTPDGKLLRKGVPGTNFNQYAILPGVPTKSPGRPMKEQSPDQEAFGKFLTPKAAKGYLNQFPPVPKMRATYPRTVEGGSRLHPKHQHTQLPDLKPGDKGYMNRGMVMEMGYKALKEAMTNPLADQNPLRNPAQSQDPNRGLGLITLRLR